jgi:DNA-binding PadR family transcriptional regulator
VLARARRTHAVIVTTKAPVLDRYDVERLFVEWVWNARFRADWDDAVRALARTLRGLEKTRLIERRTIRRTGHPTHHGFVLTDLGREAAKALSGEWIEEGQR